LNAPAPGKSRGRYAEVLAELDSKLSAHELAQQRYSLLEQLDQVEFAVDVARSLADEPDMCGKALLNLCDAVDRLAKAVKQSRRR
jgi:hypothetical protein